MKVIREPSAAAALICARQKVKNDEAYRPTTLCVQTDCEAGTLLFHTLTGMLILLESGQERENCREALIQNWFLVPESFDDIAFADQVARVAKLLHANKEEKCAKTSFTVLTTTDCNARCYYCYEAGVRRISMSAQTAQDVAEYIIRACGGEAVELHWFGGEPLYNAPAIDMICRRLRDAGIRYQSFMITNGYYLDRDMLAKAAELWYLKKVQITLDGTGETYRRIKAYVSADGDAYERVLQNIEDTRSAGIEVYIRLNVGSGNVDELMRLADELAVRFPCRENLHVYPSLLGRITGENRKFSIENNDADAFLRLKAKLRTLGLDNGMEKLKSELKANTCMADNDACEIILPDGRLCRCERELECDSYGSIYTAERDLEKIAAWKEQVKLPACDRCALYPRCTMLRKCGWVNEDCAPSIQMIRRESLQEQIIEAYHHWEKEGSS